MTRARDLSKLLGTNSNGVIDNTNITLDAAEVPSLDTAKITTGTFASARLDNSSLSAITALPAGVGGSPMLKNIVINGDMKIAQRSTSVASITTTGYYTLDRFRTAFSSLGTWTMSQSTDVPTGEGFAKSLKLDCTTADASPSAGDLMILQHLIEGQNLQYLKKGTANAVSLTASFYVKSTKTGTFILELNDTNNTRGISKSYTVNTTNTWEKKTITFEGDTTGAFTNDNGASLEMNFYLGAGTNFTSGTLATTWGARVMANQAVGQVNIADNTANDWLITGVQLEAGTTDTDFEFLPIDVSLGRCQRYYHTFTFNTNYCFASGSNLNTTPFYCAFPCTMRATPTYTTGFSNVDVATEGTSSINPSGIRVGFYSTVTSYANANFSPKVDAEL